MKIKIVASGSTGNCYLIQSEKANVLIEAGVDVKQIKKITGLKMTDLSGILISHKHKDHSKYAGLISKKYGVKVYANSDTLESFEEKYIKTEELKHNKSIFIKDLYITPLQMKHDVDCLGFIIVDVNTDERLLFFTDTSAVNYELPKLHFIMAECNYSEEFINRNVFNGVLNRTLGNRIKNTHFSVEKLEALLNRTDISEIKQIYIMHLSDNNSNTEQFTRQIQGITGIPVTVC